MPELPEVETLCRQLNALLPGEEIIRIEVFDSRLGKIEGLVGRRVEAVTRRGKYIQIQMNGGMTVALHLRMSGRLLYLAADGLPPLFPYRRLAITFSSGTLLLIDPRRFATFAVQPEGIVPALPDDPMKGLPARRLREIARTRRLPVKSFLMDQRLIAGIGNIYACEILFAAGIDPRRPACSLTTAEWRKVAKAAAAILRRAVACRGTTVSDWRDLFGCSGTNQDHLEVYSRQGAPCRRCGGSIERIIQSGRGTWLCPICQK
ncbi:MAG: bifunctional DNA-formamidopyrimidine glycosylase/DNA-(apurinic or apyrimidinic site) lyase [Deltaproteobacteria bacterium]|nr:bifunctional DNA-formamidopyrimidine glycosylase/DNA-(apurinic or apyrimidinic site) lyase [Deltaproteobacteria bacterium]